MRFVCLTLIVAGCLGAFFELHAQVRSSSNYQIQSDSINLGGGLSSSTNFVQESTMGEIASGRSTSTNFNLSAGYQQMQEVYLALGGGNDVVMSPGLPGIGGGFANGSTTVTATTDSPSGYQLTIAAASTPAMQKGADTFADYAPVGAVPDRIFTTGAADVHFGYSPDGADVVDRFKDDDSDCGVGSNITLGECWDGLSTVAEPIAQNTNSNHPDGTDTTVYFRVGIGGSAVVIPGDYVATTTLTLLAL